MGVKILTVSKFKFWAPVKPLIKSWVWGGGFYFWDKFILHHKKRAFLLQNYFPPKMGGPQKYDSYTFKFILFFNILLKIHSNIPYG